MNSFPQIPPETIIAQLEELTLSRANETLTIIDETITVWKNTKIKPAHLKPRMEKIINFHGLLSAWTRKMIKASRSPGSERLLLLSEFTDICLNSGVGS